MKTQYKIKALFVLLLTSTSLSNCEKQQKQEVAASLPSPSAHNISPPDTSNFYIYDFMQMVIADQELDMLNGLEIEPTKLGIGSSSTATFLQSLLLEKPCPKDELSKNFSISFPPKCLNQAEINAMLDQQKQIKDFHWDAKRLGFAPSNRSNYYAFSVPLFSPDSSKVLLTIGDFCPGLCGTENTWIYSRYGQKWESTLAETAIH